MLLCGSCHTSIDKTPAGYPASDLTTQHNAFLEAIRFAASAAHTNSGAGLIVLGRHFSTKVGINPSQLQAAMWRDHLRPLRAPLTVELPELGEEGRDARYYRNVRTKLEDQIARELSHARGILGDEPCIGVVAIADMPSLMILGQVLGDRRRRKIYSSDRSTGLAWPDLDAKPAPFIIDLEDDDHGSRPTALVMSISADIPDRDIRSVLPNAAIARFSASERSYSYLKNFEFVGHFRDQLQGQLSVLEARSSQPINVFLAIPAALAIEFGALLSTNHRHSYRIYDRDRPTDEFRQHLALDSQSQELAA